MLLSFCRWLLKENTNTRRLQISLHQQFPCLKLATCSQRLLCLTQFSTTVTLFLGFAGTQLRAGAVHSRCWAPERWDGGETRLAVAEAPRLWKGEVPGHRARTALPILIFFFLPLFISPKANAPVGPGPHFRAVVAEQMRDFALNKRLWCGSTAGSVPLWLGAVRLL